MSLLDTASLIVTPNGYKEGKLYSVIPSDGSGDMSVVRATTATRINAQGLVELVPYNLVTYSEQFDNAVWGAPSNVVANSVISPSGVQDADTLTGALYRLQVFSAIQYVFSFYAKKNTSSTFSMRVDAPTNQTFNFNLDTGTADNGATMVNVGNGWYRCLMPFTSGFSGTGVFYPNVNNDNLYIWGAQLVEGSTAKDYQKTETRLNIPRLDYSNGTCPSLLVEPQRTNLITYSSSFDNADWVKVTSTITANSTTSPSGIQDADTLVATSDYGRIEKVVTYTDAPYTLSVFIKKSSVSQIFALAFSAIGGIDEFSVNINTGAIISQGANISMVACEDYGDYWRVIGTSTRVSGGSVSTRTVRIFGGYPININAVIWGAQLEVGAYPTSYIPTTSASVTRNADVISKTGISSLIGQTEGTIYAEVNFPDLQNGGASSYVYITDGSFSNSVIIGREPATPSKYFFYINASGSIMLSNTSNNLQSGYAKMAIAYKSGDWAAYLNGTLVASGTSSFSFSSSINRFSIGCNDGFQTIVGSSSMTKAAALWPTRLTNDQLAQLTTI